MILSRRSLPSRLFSGGALLMLFATPLTAERPHPAPESSAISDYVRARAADDLGELNVAANGYAAALAANPGDTDLALRTLRQAVAAGDMALAVKTARTLDAANALPPDGTLLLAGEAIGRKDWKAANALVDRAEKQKLFAFLVPTMRAWTAYGSRKGDPMAFLSSAGIGGLAATYASEHRALLLIATGHAPDGIAAIQALDSSGGARAARLHIAAAASLAQRHNRDAALTLLVGDDSAIARARATLTAGRKLRGAIDSPATGIAELFVRVAADINHDQANALALEFARIAATLAPDDSEAWLVTANLLAGTGDSQAALDALGRIAADDPFVGAARDARLTLLARSGRTVQALAEARTAASAPDASAGDLARLGDLQMNGDHYAAAAAAYGRAIVLAGGEKAPGEVAWPLLLQQANALLQAGDWPGAKMAGEHAVALAPQEPAVLNFLGYSQLERGENVAGASAMIAQAQALAPDDPSITDSLGWSWYVRGDLSKAIPLLEQAARGAPAESDINEHLGDAYWRAGRQLEARYAWRAALVAADTDQAKRIQAKIDNGRMGTP
jgi:Flp pilus assembly protein TadD